jgi:hypothetical protein
MNLGAIVLIAFAVLLFTPLPRLLIAALFGKQIARAALAKQPATIHLVKIDPSSFRRAERVRALVSEYLGNGFRDGGSYEIPELPGVKLQLLVNARESMYGTVYEHPVAGIWCDVVSRYLDGSAWMHSSARPTGIEPRDNTRQRNLPGAEPMTLIANQRTERTSIGMRPASADTAVSDFETAYAEYMTWLKQRGISTGEVVEVARRKIA